MSTFNFPLLLTVIVFLTGIIWLVDVLFFKRRRLKKTPHAKEPKLVEYSRSFFPVLLLVLVIRSFIIQPYRVPTGSLEPTILPGDFIAVNQFAYGLRLPVINTKIASVGEPEIGQIAVFRWPVDPNVDFIKRVVGTPGDHVVYKNKVLYINGKEATQKLIGGATDYEEGGNLNVKKYQENLNGIKHDILVNPYGGQIGDFDVVVPKGYYFMMGDNRDNSADSRDWGFVPEENLIGKGFFIWMSWDSQKHRVRWRRIGTVL